MGWVIISVNLLFMILLIGVCVELLVKKIKKMLGKNKEYITQNSNFII